MNAISEDIKDMLIGDSSLGLIFDTTGKIGNLFIGREPVLPINCVTIYDTPGFPPDINLTSQGYERPSIQIKIRNRDYITGWNLIESIKNFLHGKAQEVWNNTLYSIIYCSSNSASLGFDNNNNALFVVNFNIQRRENN